MNKNLDNSGENTVICEYCGAKIRAGVKFCGNCGTAHKYPDAEAKFCRKCGTEIKPGAKFCRNCGYNLTEKTGVAANAKSVPEDKTPVNIKQPEPEIITEPNSINSNISPTKETETSANIKQPEPEIITEPNLKNSNQSPTKGTEKEIRKKDVKPKKKGKRAGVAVVLLLASALAVYFLFVKPSGFLDKLFDGKQEQVLVSAVNLELPEMAAASTGGELVAGRTMWINGQGFGDYEKDTCGVTIDRKNATIISWSADNIVVVVPDDIKNGKQEIKVTGTEGSVKRKEEFAELKKTVIAEGVISKNSETIISGGGYKLVIPAASVVKEEKLTISTIEVNRTQDSAALNTTILEYEVNGEAGADVEFKAPVMLAVDLSAAGAERKAGNDYFSYTYDTLQGRWFKQQSIYDKKQNTLYIKAEHFCPGKVTAASSDGKLEGKYCIVYYTPNNSVTSVNTGVSSYKISDDVASDVQKYFDNYYEKYKASLGTANVPDLKYTTKDPKDATAWEKTYSAMRYLSVNKTIIQDNRVAIYISTSYDGQGAVQKSLTGNICLPAAVDTADELKDIVAHELFHIVQAKSYGSLKKLVSAGPQKNLSSLNGLVVNSGFFLDATAEYASKVIAQGMNRIDLTRQEYSQTSIGKAYYTYEQSNISEEEKLQGGENKKLASHEYGMSAFIQFLVDKSIYDGKNTDRSQAFGKLWLGFVKKAGWSSDITAALDDTVKNFTGYASTQIAYQEFWRSVLTDSDAAKFNSANGIENYNLPNEKYATAGVEFIASARKGGYAASSFTIIPNSYKKLMPETKVQSFWVSGGDKEMMATDIFVLEPKQAANSSNPDNIRDKKKLSKAVEFDKLFDGKQNNVKPITFTVGQKKKVIRVFTANLSGEQFKENLKLLASCVKWENEADLMKFYNNNYKSSVEKEFIFKLDGFHEQYQGNNGLIVGISFGDGSDVKKFESVDANTTLKVKHSYLPKDIKAKQMKITITVKDKDNHLLHQYEKELSFVTLNFNSSSYNGQLNQELKFTASGKKLPKNSKYMWDFGDGETLETSVSKASHTYKKEGKFKVTLELFDKDSKNTKPVTSAEADVIVLKTDPWIGRYLDADKNGYSIEKNDSGVYVVVFGYMMKDLKHNEFFYPYFDYEGKKTGENTMTYYDSNKSKVTITKDKNSIYVNGKAYTKVK